MESAVRIVCRDNFFVQRRVIAPDRSIILVIQSGNTCNQDQRSEHGKQPVGNPFVPFVCIFNFNQKQQDSRKNAHEDQPQHQ